MKRSISNGEVNSKTKTPDVSLIGTSTVHKQFAKRKCLLTWNF